MRKMIVGAVSLALGAGGAWYWYTNYTQTFSVDSRDTITTWDFQGSHNDDGPNEQRVMEEIARLNERLQDDETEPPDYQLYVGIAGQYTLLGDGKKSFEYLNKAFAEDPDRTTGLAWRNMGVLMERLGALHSARIAYQQAVDAQPQMEGYHVELLNFLIAHDSEDRDAILAALDRAEKEFKTPAFAYLARAQWLEGQGSYGDAISAWERLKEVSPEGARADIDEKIARLRSQL